MSKRKADSAGDVLVNRLNVGLAKHKRLMASWSRPAAPPSAGADAGADADALDALDDADFRDGALGHEQLGVGGRVPSEAQDGTFTRRALSTNDKLLQQLVGKKAAKAHILAREVPKLNSGVQNPTKAFQAPKPAESEDDEDGRAATFKSKRRKTAQPKPAAAPQDASEHIPQPAGAGIPGRPAAAGDAPEESTPDTASEQAPKGNDRDTPVPASSAGRGKPKPGSYLDEILAARSKKRNNKKKNKDKASA